MLSHLNFIREYAEESIRAFSEDQVKKCSGIWWISPTSGDHVLCRRLKEGVFLPLCPYNLSTYFTILYPPLSRWQKRGSSLKESQGLLSHVLPSVLLVGDVLRNTLDASALPMLVQVLLLLWRHAVLPSTCSFTGKCHRRCAMPVLW